MMKNEATVNLGGFPDPTTVKLLKSPKSGTLYIYTEKIDPKSKKISWSLSKLEKVGLNNPDYPPNLEMQMQ